MRRQPWTDYFRKGITNGRIYTGTQRANFRVWANDAILRRARGLALMHVHAQEAREERVRGEAATRRRRLARTKRMPAGDISRSKDPPKDTRRRSPAKLYNCRPRGPSWSSCREIQKPRPQGAQQQEARQRISYFRFYHLDPHLTICEMNFH